MEQNNFEKKIQQKLGELKIPPSDAVWENIEKNISKRKDRKKIPIFFLLFICVAAGGYFIFNSMQDSEHLQNKLVSTSVEKISKQTLPTGRQAKSKDSSFNQTMILTANDSEKSNVSEVNPTNNKIPPQKLENNNVERKTTNEPGSVRNNTRGVTSENKSAKGIEEIDGNKKTLPDVRQANSQKNDLATNSLENVQEKNAPNISAGAENGPNKNIEPQHEVTIQNKKIPGTILADTKNVFAKKISESTDKTRKNSQSRKWRLGVTASGGTSMIGGGGTPVTQNLSSFASMDFISLPSPASNYSLSSVNNYFRPSPIKNSIAFTAGVFIEKNIFRKNKIDLGISYKYYSLTNTTGSKIDFNIAPSLSTENLYSSWSNTNTYRNNFHYIEIPVSVKFQLGNSETLPIYWSAGISISQLISSNSLQFKSVPGLYYNDNSLYNKTQVGLQTGFSALLFAKTKVPIGIGPYFSYNTSKMANDGLYGGKHFSFIGIKAEILLGKK